MTLRDKRECRATAGSEAAMACYTPFALPFNPDQKLLIVPYLIHLIFEEIMSQCNQLIKILEY